MTAQARDNLATKLCLHRQRRFGSPAGTQLTRHLLKERLGLVSQIKEWGDFVRFFCSSQSAMECADCARLKSL